MFLSTINLVSQKKRSMVLQSFYMESGDYKKKKSAKTLLMQDSLSHTPKVRAGQTSDITIPQESNDVNTFSEKTEKMSDRDFARDQDNEEQVLYSDRDPDILIQREKVDKILEEENAKLKEDMIAYFYEKINH